MNTPERPESPAEDDPEAAAELAWLKAKQADFLKLAQEKYAEQGRGALVIRPIPDEPLGVETPITYAALARVATREDPASQRLAEFLETYDPESQLVAVFVRPGEQFIYNIYQVGVGDQSGAQKAQDLTPINQRICEITQRLDRDEQIIEEDLRETLHA
jgi:hypothetical protein